MIYRLTVLDLTRVDKYGSSLIPPALARVNRQLRDEVVPIYYRETKFLITLYNVPGPASEAFRHRCTLTTHFFPLIRSLHSRFDKIDTEPFDLMDWIMKIGERPDFLWWQGLHAYLMTTTWALYLRPCAPDWIFLEEGIARTWYSY
ncbi:hypothetical protein RRF57_001757 [Xylaria bambusicola]|uniref:Uncharacterized protein n=1 Tax=Xylaria bambusicola TaxID=326684 RepID=A0AAN7UHQ0_9PEZI